MTAPSISTATVRNCLCPLLAALETANALLATQDLHTHDRALLNAGLPAAERLVAECRAAEKRAQDEAAAKAEFDRVAAQERGE